MEVNNQKLWLYIVSYKSTEAFYNCDSNSITIQPNRIQVNINEILYISTDKVEKNFTKVVLQNQKEYFFDGSMIKLEKKIKRLSSSYKTNRMITFLQITKHTKIRPLYFTKSLGFDYIFSDYLTKPLKVNNSYKEQVKKHFGF